MTPRRTPRNRRAADAAPEPRGPAPSPQADPADDFERGLATVGERLRQAALGLTAALVVARMYWPGEAFGERDTGHSLGWSLAMLVAAALAIFSAFFAGRFAFRLSWADAAAYALFALVALSARRGAAARVSINLAWEWVGVGLAYALLRNLPRDRRESSALAGILAATAVALAAYGLYQVGVVFPEVRRAYLANPEAALRAAGVVDEPVARRAFEDRLLGSKEPIGTFALANSLAGALLAPAVLALAALAVVLGERPRRGGPVAALVALPALLVLLGALVLTKSRTAYLALVVGGLVLAWGMRRRVPPRVALGVGLGAAALVGGLVAAALATRQLDPLVLTESTKSLRYRAEYWQGTWRLLRDEPGVWWSGLGPGNFGAAYLRHKLPQASESISDPHDLLLEAWTTAGLPALVALAAALALGLRAVLGPGRGDAPARDEPGPDAEPVGRGAGWLVVASGAGGIALAWALRPDLSPFAGDYPRWIVLAGAWAWAAMTGLPLALRRPPLAAGLGAGALALAFNLLAAGGLGYAPVALMLWGFLALGQDLRTDRPCGQLRALEGRPPSFALAAAWAAVAGTFAGTAGPHFAAQMALDRGEELEARALDEYGAIARRLPAEVPAADRAAAAYERAQPWFQRAEAEFVRAHRADRLAARPWQALAWLQFQAWRARGMPTDVGDLVWPLIRRPLDQARTPPRNPDSLDAALLCARLAGEVLARPGLPEFERQAIRADRLKALRQAVRLNPTDPALRVALSDVLESEGLDDQAAAQAAEALRLARLLAAHPNRRLLAADVRRLRARVEAAGADADGP
jgi:O-antigen ligase